MIGKGNTHSDGVKLAQYLLEPGPGERTELLGMRGLGVHGNPIEGFREQAELAGQTRAEKPFFHVQMRGAAGELQKLSRAEILEIVDGADRVLGRAMTEQPRIASLHIDKASGDFHIHIAHSLVTRAEDGRYFVQRLGKYENKLQLYAREVELKYGLQILSNEARPGARRGDRNELEESRRLGTDLHAIRTAILDSFRKSDNGRAFHAAIKEQGMELAPGDRRDCFVVIDQAGGQHALNKKLTGLTLKEINARLSDLDRAQLPSVDRAKQTQQARAAEHARSEVQGREKHGPGVDGAVGEKRATNGPQRGAAAVKPLGQTAGEIRLAWQLTKTGAQFAQAIEDRGLILVHVSREEAADSYRAREYAKVINRQNRALKEGFAAVDRRGNVYRVDQRTTGDLWEEIQKKLGGIDRRELLTVEQARAVQAEARKAEFVEQKRAEREAARPATAIESKIAAALQSTMTGYEFAEALDRAGLTIARANAADVTALAALREQEGFARASGIAHKPRHFATLAAGDIAAINGVGDVFRLSPHKVDLAEIGERVADTQTRLPSIVEARALNEIKRERNTEAWAERHADSAARRAAVAEARNADRSLRDAAASVQHGKQETLHTAERAVDVGARALGGVSSGLASAAENLLSGIFGFFGATAPELTPEQAVAAAQAAEERATARAQAAAEAEKEAAQDWIIFALDRQRQEEELDRQMGRGDDEGRERERERERER